jgi:pimeloyl-ACP methyl ester carboxylesterase
MGSARQDSSAERDALLAALNGVAGDYLVDTQNPLAITMRLRQNGRPLELEQTPLAVQNLTRKLLVLVHGLCMSDLQWDQQGFDYGAALGRDLGYTPVYLHYNSGLHISTNGAAFAGLLDGLVRQWPAPLDELVIVAHSMGGLVARSAYLAGSEAGLAWPAVLRKLVFLGAPHHGSPVERAGNWLITALGVSGYSAPFARLGKLRSPGMTDMRYGSLRDTDWKHQDRFAPSGDTRQPAPLPAGVRCYAIGAVTGKTAAGPVDAFVGDGLVPLRSALGQHPDPRLSLAFPPEQQWVGYKMNHFDLLRKPEVYVQIRQWLAG